MYSKTIKIRTVNVALTKLIIQLHEKGYTEDFIVTNSRGTAAALYYENGAIEIEHFEIFIINQFFDALTSASIYLHAVETPEGLKGIVLSDAVLFTSQTQCVLMKNRPSKIISDRSQSWSYRTAI